MPHKTPPDTPLAAAPSQKKPLALALEHIQGLLWFPNMTAKTIAGYSVGVVVLVNAIGFIVTTYHYSRAGVSVGSIPVATMAAAGLSCAFFTLLFAFIGHAAGSAERIPKQLELAFPGLAASGVLLSFTGGWKARIVIFALIQLVPTYLLARGRRIRHSKGNPEAIWDEDDPAQYISLVTRPLFAAYVFSYFRYSLLEEELEYYSVPRSVVIAVHHLRSAAPLSEAADAELPDAVNAGALHLDAGISTDGGTITLDAGAPLAVTDAGPTAARAGGDGGVARPDAQ